MRHPEWPVAVSATDEHRRGLKPITRRVRAPSGERAPDRARPSPLRRGSTSRPACSRPAAGEVSWSLSTGLPEPFFEALLAEFAEEAGAGRERRIVLVLDQAGWHTGPDLAVPDGIGLVHLPRSSPELQPAECLWPRLDEPLVNRHFARTRSTRWSPRGASPAMASPAPSKPTPTSTGGPNLTSRPDQTEAV